ncbi:MAG: phosphoribosylformylglycinamidine synthase, partial [Saezia sp.]
FDLRAIPLEESGMSPKEIWSNESQERYVMAIAPESLDMFTAMCARERAPFAVVGRSTEERVLVLEDKGHDTPVDMPLDVLLGKPPKMQRNDKHVVRNLPAIDLSAVTLDEACENVLRHPTVASKRFLINIGDRTVGALTHRDQMVGPWQVPVADCAVTLADYAGFRGEAMSMGERTPLAVINASASGRMAIGEAITNILSAPVSDLTRVKLSANWMAACGKEGEDAALYDTVKAVGMELCPALGLSIPVGKDSLSMSTRWQDNKGVQKQVTSPVSLIVSAFASLDDVRATWTPQIKTLGEDTSLILIDLGKGQNRLGVSILAQTLNQVGNTAPDLDNPNLIKSLVESLHKLREESKILAYHDRSDGGLWATVCEMAFAGHTGVSIHMDALVTDKGAKNENMLAALFAEELGVVVQVKSADCDAALATLAKYGLGQCSHVFAKPNATDCIELFYDGKTFYSKERVALYQVWDDLSWRMCMLRDNPESAQSEHNLTDSTEVGLHWQPTFKLQRDEIKPYLSMANKPKIAILREQGVNSHMEMAWAMAQAGFDVYDVHMTDLQQGRTQLKDYTGLVTCGGFSYGDTLGAGQGWARSILFNAALRSQFEQFFKRQDTFALGVCNGCQMLAALAEIIPGAEHWPIFTRNRSEQFEARLSMVEVLDSPSILFKGMAGTRLPIAVSHGEGYANFDAKGCMEKSMPTMRYCDAQGCPTEVYPLNPNGSPQGVTSFTTADGRFSIMMPHPERVFRNVQMSWTGGDISELSPWMQIFYNARKWVGDNSTSSH